MARMVQMMMGRDYTLRTMQGHAIRFKAMEPKWIPKSVENEAMRFGAFPVDPEDKAVQQSEQQQREAAQEPTEPREERIRDTIKAMIDENNRDDFTGTGRPKTDVIMKRAQLDTLHAQERDEIHDAIKAEQAS